MRLNFCTSLVALLVLAAGAGPAAEPKSTTPGMAIQFHNGTLVKEASIQGAIEIMTRYGKFTIPPQDIRRIDFGFRMLDEETRKLDLALQNLNKDNFEQREAATRELIALGRAAYPALVKAAAGKNKELDTTQRIDKALQEIRKSIPSDQLKFAEEDMIHTADAVLRGKITTDILKVHAAVLGDLQLPLAHLRSIRAMAGYRVVRIEPANMEPWVDTNVELPAGAHVAIKVTGTIQMDVAGQKLQAGPQGSTDLQREVNRRVGHNVSSPVGMLQGRIIRPDNQADAISIGNRYEGVIGEGGKLSLRIYVGGPHDFALSGGYQLEIEIE